MLPQRERYILSKRILPKAKLMITESFVDTYFYTDSFHYVIIYLLHLRAVIYTRITYMINIRPINKV